MLLNFLITTNILIILYSNYMKTKLDPTKTTKAKQKQNKTTPPKLDYNVRH